MRNVQDVTVENFSDAPGLSSTSSNSADVSTKDSHYLDMLPYWEMINDLIQGTPAMREAGIKYLFQNKFEKANEYKKRLYQTTLYPGTEKNINRLLGKAFSNGISLDKDVAKVITGNDTTEGIIENIDGQGTHFNIFARNLFRSGLKYGISYVLTEFPDVNQIKENNNIPNNQALTMAQQKGFGIRPYWVMYEAKDVFRPRSQIVNGRRVLNQISLIENSLEPDGWGEKEVRRIRVLEPGKWTLYRKEKNDWYVERDGTTSLSEIPLVPFYTNYTGFFRAAIPLLHCAYLNVEHWQSKSYQRHILEWSRFAVLFMKMIENKGDVPFDIGMAIEGHNEHADMKYVEISGASIESGERDLRDLEEKMDYVASELMRKKQGNITATEIRTDEQATNSMLGIWMENLRDTLELSLGYIAEYSGLPTIEGGSVVINTDFDLTDDDQWKVDSLRDLQQDGIITKKTRLRESKKYILDDDLDIDAELKEVEIEGGGMDKESNEFSGRVEGELE